jgi:hypothetical protein
MELWIKRDSILVHVISDEGIKVDPKKIVAVIEWPSPKSITSLRGFLGLTEVL